MKKIFILIMLVLLLSSGAVFAKERQGTVTFKIDLSSYENSKNTRLWLPYPLSGAHQVIKDVKVNGSYNHSSLYQEPNSGAIYLYNEWNGNSDPKTLELSFNVKAEERTVTELKDTFAPVPDEVKKHLRPNWWIASNDKIKELTAKITKDKKGILEKSRAVYDWVVDNTFRDPDVKGCGYGIVEQMLEKRGGKCVDISSVYIALARASGVPAREVFGLRLGKKPEQSITGGFHCWAEFYLPDTGWVPVDPADVRKLMLVKDLTLEQAKPYREYYFGAVDEYRITLEKSGRGLNLFPLQKGEPLNYFMYPYAEIDGEAIDYLEPKEFKYSVHFKEI